jgi:hypothetical protein
LASVGAAGAGVAAPAQAAKAKSMLIRMKGNITPFLRNAFVRNIFVILL